MKINTTTTNMRDRILTMLTHSDTLDYGVMREGLRITIPVSRSEKFKRLFGIVIHEDTDGTQTSVKVYSPTADLVRRQIVSHGCEASIEGVLKRITEIIEHFDSGNDSL